MLRKAETSHVMQEASCLDFVRAFWSQSLLLPNLLMYLCLTPTCKQSSIFSNADIAALIVDGAPAGSTYGRVELAEDIKPLCPNAIVIVQMASVVAVKAVVWPEDEQDAKDNYGGIPDLDGFHGFMCFKKHRDEATGSPCSAQDWARRWVASLPEQHTRPIIFALYQMRSASFRLGDRCAPRHV